jgi:Icc-related predicted phosphoesterase
MKIHILNDLHIEFSDFTIPETDADVIVLAGDIGVGLAGLQWLEKQQLQKPVIYVPGNHEYYQHDLSLIDAMQNNAVENIHVLNDDVVEIDNVRFLGSTLWTDFDYFGETDKFFAKQHARKNMADFSAIKYAGKVFTPDDAITLHHKSRGWLKCMLEDNFQGKTVVVTHHAPSSGSVHPRFARDLLTAAFVSNLEGMMDGSRISLWIHGHMHDTCDYEVFDTRVICNPRGYVPYEKSTGFVPDLVIDV